MKRAVSYALMGVVVVVALMVGVLDQGEARTAEDRLEDVARTVRCPACRSQSAWDSQAPTAVAVRQDIRPADRRRAERRRDPHLLRGPATARRSSSPRRRAVSARWCGSSPWWWWWPAAWASSSPSDDGRRGNEHEQGAARVFTSSPSPTSTPSTPRCTSPTRTTPASAAPTTSAASPPSTAPKAAR